MRACRARAETELPHRIVVHRPQRQHTPLTTPCRLVLGGAAAGPVPGSGGSVTPAFAADYFGPKNVGSVYGLMLTAWGVAGIVGPTLIARIRESSGEYSTALYVISGIMLVSAIIPFIVRPPLSQQEAATEAAPEPSPASPRTT